MPRVHSKLSSVLHAHRGANLFEDLRNEKDYRSKRAIVRFREARVKGTMAFLECLGISNEDKMEGSLCR